MKFEECIDKGLIKKDPGATGRVDNSLKIAERFLKSARKNLETEEYEMTEIAAYNSGFHSARALLFAKGYTERSHSITVLALHLGIYIKKMRLLSRLTPLIKSDSQDTT